MESKRAKETMILILLVIVAACYGFYVLLLSPKMARATELKTEVNTNDTIVRGYYESILQYSEDSGTLREIQSQANEVAVKFYIDTCQEDYLEDLDAALKVSGATWEKVEASEHGWLQLITAGVYRCQSPYIAYATVTEEELKAMEDDTEQLLAVLETIEEAAEGPGTDQLTIQVDLTGTYQNVKAMVSALEQMQRNVICSGFDLKTEEGAAGVSGSSNPAVTASLGLQFLRLSDVSSQASENEFPELPQTFAMPSDFVSGSYRELISVSWLADLF